jgi:hypothetical protein
MMAMVLAILAVTGRGAEPRLSVHLKIIEGHTVELSLRNKSAGQLDGDASSAFMLLPVDSSEDAVPDRSLWGPADPPTGRAYSRAMCVGPGGITPPPDPDPKPHAQGRPVAIG